MDSQRGTIKRNELAHETGDRHPLCLEFRRQWDAGHSPPLGRFLCDAARQPPPARFERLALELIKIDMSCRWSAAGNPSAGGLAADKQGSDDEPLPMQPRLDDYTRAFPQLGEPVDAPIELIRLEYKLRCQQATRPPAEEFFERFKGRGDILDILELVDASHDSTPAATSRDPARPRSVRLSCPHCRELVSVDGDRSRAVTCAHCGYSIRLVSGTTVPVLENDRFEIIDRLGIGGFGTVWRARDNKLDRIVALKLPRRGQFEGVDTEKFLREARAAAQLNHDNIVTVHDFDRDGDDCFIVSEVVDGVSLAKWLEDHELSFVQAAKLCHTVALALDYAHRQGIVHRDLKPSNIIVDKNLVPHITDFGLAKRDAGELTMTIDGQLLGTPSYMSPEQASGHSHQVDGRADIYALGVMLYRFLTGELPFRGDVHMMLHHVVHNDPVPPRQLNHRIPRDLETICLKCLEKQPSRRFRTAAELADELGRFLHGQPIRSRPQSTVMRAWRWALRHRMAALAAALLVFISAASPVVVWRESQLRRNTVRLLAGSLISEADAEVAGRASGFRQRAVSLCQRAIKLVPGIDRVRVREIVTRSMGEFLGFEPTVIQINGVISSVTRDDDSGDYAVGTAEGRVAIVRSDGTWICSYLPYGPVTDPPERRPIRALRLEPQSGAVPSVVTVDGAGRVVRRRTDATAELVAELDMDSVTSAQFSADHRWLIALDDTAVEVWSAASWQRQSRLPADVREPLISVCRSDDGRYVAAGFAEYAPDQCGFVRWDLTTGQRDVVRVEHDTTTPNGICFSADSHYIAFGCSNLLIYDAATLQLFDQLPSHDVKAVAASGDGRYLASYNYQGDIQVWNASTWQPLITCSSPAFMNSSGRFGLYFSSHHRHFVASYGDTLRIWDLNQAPERQRLVQHRKKIGAVTFSHGGTLAAAASHDGTVSVWDVGTWQPAAAPLDVKARVHCVAFSPDDRYLAAATWDLPIIYVWSTSDWRRVEAREHELSDITSLSFHVQSNHLVASAAAGLGVWELRETDDDVKLEQVYSERVNRALHSVLCTQEAKAVWVAGNEKLVRICDLATRSSSSLGGGQATMLDGWHGLALFPDGRRLIFVGPQKKLEIWDIVDGSRLHAVEQVGELHLPLVALSPDGKMLATKTDPKSVVIWNTESWERLFVLPAENASVDTVAWHPTRQLIAIGVSDGLISIWDISRINHELGLLEMRPVETQQAQPQRATSRPAAATSDRRVQLVTINR